jgi:hypothetical protein
LTAALYELFEPRDDRVAGKSTARVREIGGAGAVARAETTNTVGAEPTRSVSRALEKLLELDPRRGSICNELV